MIWDQQGRNIRMFTYQKLHIQIVQSECFIHAFVQVFSSKWFSSLISDQPLIRWFPYPVIGCLNDNDTCMAYEDKRLQLL